MPASPYLSFWYLVVSAEHYVLDCPIGLMPLNFNCNVLLFILILPIIFVWLHHCNCLLTSLKKILSLRLFGKRFIFNFHLSCLPVTGFQKCSSWSLLLCLFEGGQGFMLHAIVSLSCNIQTLDFFCCIEICLFQNIMLQPYSR